MFTPLSFLFWFGVVEDRNDPLQLGRCRIRIVGYHTQDTVALPTVDLPWAIPSSPITSAAMSGIGDAPVGPVEGTWTWGFFADGSDNQEPIYCGTMNGIPQSTFFSSLKSTDGFRDPSKHYPLTTLMDEPTTNRLARGVSSGTIVDAKNNSRDTGIAIARTGGSWDQPVSPFNASYPFNHVFQSESGHTKEYDDTPNAERTLEYHKTGTFTEIDRNGTKVQRIVGDNYEIYDRNGFIHIKGMANLTVEGNVNIYVKNNCNLQVDGDLKTDVHGDYELNVAGSIDIVAGKMLAMSAEIGVGVSGGTVYIEADTIGAISSPIWGMAAPVMPQSILTINPFLAKIEATAAKLTSGLLTIPDPVDPKSPSEPNLQALGFTLSVEQQTSFALEKTKAFMQANDMLAPAIARSAATEYGNLKTDELNTNQQVSAPVKHDPNAVTPDKYKCPVGARVVTAALADVGVVETGALLGLNTGGVIGGGSVPLGVSGRIDQMLAGCGLDNLSQVARTGTGFNWCAAAVHDWWTSAGLPTPSGAASCENWEIWGRSNGYFSNTPVIGAAILYGTTGSAHHMGIVSAIDDNGNVTQTVEGNTTGSGFTTNGVCVAVKTPRTFLGFIIPPPCAS